MNKSTFDTSFSQAELLHLSVSRHPDFPAITFEGTTYSYKTFWNKIMRVAHWLQQHNIRSGDNIAYVGTNHISFLEMLFAANLIGARFVPMNFRLARNEMLHILNDAKVVLVVADEPSAKLLSGVEESVTKLIVDGHMPGWLEYNDLADLSGTNKIPEAAANEDALILYTSGTTGASKGAVLTNRNLFWNFINTVTCGEPIVGRVSLTCAPMFHVGGLNVTTLPTLFTGGHVVLHKGFDPEAVLKAIEALKVECFWAAPSMLLMLAAEPKFREASFASLKMLVCGGAPVPPSLIRTFNERDVLISQGYGLTETSAFATLLGSKAALDKIGSAGKPPLFGEIKIKLAGDPVDTSGQRGEVLIRGPMVFDRYWMKETETDESNAGNGWFRTGDIGYQDQDGYLFIADRVKDIVISGGENIYSAEVENALFDHPNIKEVAVIGTPHPKWGEGVTAVVVAQSNEETTLEEIRIFLEGRIARYKMPIRLEYIESLPRNSAGKVLKYILRERFSAEI